jgi:hypothetical protein
VSAVIRFDRGQLTSNPPLSDVLVQGNVIMESPEELGPDGQVIHRKPRYNYAVLIESRPPGSMDGHYPRNVRIVNNMFPPGQNGICNIPLPETN